MENKYKILIQKFKEGRTSLAEENELNSTARVSNAKIFKSLKFYFQFIESGKRNASMEMKSPFKKIKTRKLRIRRISRIAAILLIFLGTTFFIINNRFKPFEKSLYSDAEIEQKYKHTLKALSSCSESFMQGMEQLKSISNFEGPGKSIEKKKFDFIIDDE